MTLRTAAAGALLLASSATAAFAQASDAVKTAPTRSEPGSSEGMLPGDRSLPQNAPGAAEGRTASGSKSNADAQKMDAEAGGKPSGSTGAPVK